MLSIELAKVKVWRIFFREQVEPGGQYIHAGGQKIYLGLMDVEPKIGGFYPQNGW